ncbi:MAG: hypothetical protein U0176_14625 [Bacteroidia bacterium]
MFNFFKPKPKLLVTPEDKQWIEANLKWLGSQFGQEVFRRYPVTIRSGPFSRYHNALRESMRYFLDEVAIHMELDPDDLDLHVYRHGSDERIDGPVMIVTEGSQSLGEYHHRNNLTGKFDIHLNETISKDLQVMLTTIAHELSHVRLIGEYRHDATDEFHEYVTDLTTIYFGFGITMANTCNSRDSWTDLHGSGWSIGKRGYLPLEVVVHTLALQALQRGDREPKWAEALGKVPRRMFQQSLLWLWENEGEVPQGGRAPSDGG